jgi:long-chain fatty acid transport protein
VKMKKIALLISVAGLSAPVFATNGMNQAGYGPVSESMGGASMAYDNGGAAAINNPATLGFMAPGTSRLDVGFGDLRPVATANGQNSTATDFLMPGFAYVRKDGDLAWGVGVMAQGGMGTQYTNGSFWGPLKTAFFGSDTSAIGLSNMSQVGVGRVMFPLAYTVNDKLNIGGSIDYVWAGMDVQWLVDGAHFADMIAPNPTFTAFGYHPTQTFGNLSGSLVNAFVGNMGVGLGQISGLSWGYFNFDKPGAFQQQATASGWAGNIGFTYKVTQALAVGGVYHAKTHLSDLTTGSTGATLSLNAFVNGLGNTTIPFVGKVTVKDFQWPETFALGLSYQVNDQWQVVADYKRINWADVMKNFTMTFEASGTQSNPIAQASVAAGNVMNLVYFQNWKNQDVFEFGAAYKYSDALTIRFGANFGTNPVPNQYVTPLFPAVMQDHYMVGFGYAFDKANSVDGGFVYAPKVSVTNNWSAVGGGTNQNISLGTDLSYQLMYSHRF